jgi:hypothetical protein
VKLLSASSRLQAIVIAAMIVAAAITTLAAVVTASGALTRNSDRLVLLHALGADDFDVIGRLVIPTGGIALLGGAVGALAAAGTWQVVTVATASLGLASAIPTVVDGRGILVLAVVTLASGIIAATAAALVARRALVRMP